MAELVLLGVWRRRRGEASEIKIESRGICAFDVDERELHIDSIDLFITDHQAACVNYGIYKYSTRISLLKAPSPGTT
jgi:hypothetical protein